MVLCSPANELMTTDAGTSEVGGFQMERLPTSFTVEDTPISDSPFLGSLEYYVTGETQSPLSCSPLDRIDPVDFAAFTQGYTGDILALEEAMSIWVEQKYKGFSKLVGMALVGFESECLSLLRRIDTERKRLRPSTGPRVPTGSVRKGTRELRNLISSVNYEGRKEAKACS